MDVSHLSVATQDKFIMSSVLENIFKNFDETHGGWGYQPKFPNALLLLFLLENQLYNQEHIQAKSQFHIKPNGQRWNVRFSARGFSQV